MKKMQKEKTPVTGDMVEAMSPYLTTLFGNKFVSGNRQDVLCDPDAHTVIAIDVNTRDFHNHYEFEYTKLKLKASSRLNKRLDDLEINGETFWKSGMQSFIVRELRLVSDDGKSVFVFYDALNNPNFVQWLGKLVDGHPSTVAVLGKMARFASEFNI